MENGTAGATNILNNSPSYAVANAFKLDNSNWESEENLFPLAIWMRFQRTYRLKKIGVRFYNGAYAPNKLIIVGSDDCANWNPLLSVENTGISTSESNPYREWTISEATRFPCLGLMFLESNGLSYGRVNIKVIHMWQ